MTCTGFQTILNTGCCDRYISLIDWHFDFQRSCLKNRFRLQLAPTSASASTRRLRASICRWKWSTCSAAAYPSAPSSTTGRLPSFTYFFLWFCQLEEHPSSGFLFFFLLPNRSFHGERRVRDSAVRKMNSFLCVFNILFLDLFFFLQFGGTGARRRERSDVHDELPTGRPPADLVRRFGHRNRWGPGDLIRFSRSPLLRWENISSLLTLGDRWIDKKKSDKKLKLFPNFDRWYIAQRV